MKKRGVENYTQKPVVDILKYFFALCVVAIHTKLLYEFFSNDTAFIIERLIMKLAVPFFFVASGYFLRRKIDDNYSNAKEQIINYCKRLVKPYSIFLLMSIILQIADIYKKGNIVFEGTYNSIIKSIILYPPGALWFIWACITGSLLLIPFLKRGKINIAILVGLALYIIMLLFNSYSFVLNIFGYKETVNFVLNNVISLRNGIHVGFFLLAIGMKCYELENIIKINKKLVFSLVALFIVYAFEIICVFKLNNYGASADDNAFYIFQVPLVFILFLLANSITSTYNKNMIFIRRLSIITYFIHRPAIQITSLANVSLNNLQMFILCVVIAIIICLLYNFINNSNNRINI